MHFNQYSTDESPPHRSSRAEQFFLEILDSVDADSEVQSKEEKNSETLVFVIKLSYL